MIDLHLHTTASDGRLTPAELVARASAAGLTTMAVTDHDTVAALAEIAALAGLAGIRAVPGIEITAVDAGRDVHMLAYFFDPADAELAAFLERQRGLRVDRVREIGERLRAMDAPIDVEAIVQGVAMRPGATVGRPMLARALMAAGHVASVQEAFDRFLATGQPAFVPRSGPRPIDVVRFVQGLGGIVSMAHPGVTRRDDLIAPLAEAGLDAIEVFHSDHAPDQAQAYQALADRLGLLVSGGSDFHGDENGRPSRASLGNVSLPPGAFLRLEARARERQAAR